MQTELATKAAESSEMQRRWLSMQTELIGLQVLATPLHALGNGWIHVIT